MATTKESITHVALAFIARDAASEILKDRPLPVTNNEVQTIVEHAIARALAWMVTDIKARVADVAPGAIALEDR